MAKSKAQKFAQKRNSAGGLLKGIIKNLEKHVEPACCDAEKHQVHNALSHLDDVMNCWSDNYEQAKDEHL